MNDLKFAFRQLLKDRGFTMVAVGSLAIGLGLAASTLAIVNAYLLRSLPYPTAERVFHLRYAPIGPWEPRALMPAIRKELSAAEPAMRPPQIIVCRQALYDSTQAQRTYMLFLVAFAAVGLLLAALGIYGVLAYSVTRRTREIGIRMAVGAERRHVLGMVMAEGGRLVGMGIVTGLVAAFWLTRLLRHQLFDVSPTEPRIFVMVVLVLTIVALLACFFPARRATKINPMEALRHE